MYLSRRGNVLRRRPPFAGCKQPGDRAGLVKQKPALPNPVNVEGIHFEPNIVHHQIYHQMKCPSCNVNLLMTERNGVEIDYCPDCRGVWLDRGELDKIIERSASKAGETLRSNPHSEYGDKHNDYDRRPYEYKKKKKESFLEDLFDF
ncbi:MAG: hypothetical protein RI973_904 [Bacteroidota bacterium]|jgi:Zn-finger nucleic acid-binding protein